MSQRGISVLGMVLSTLGLIIAVSSLYRLRHPEWVQFKRGEAEFFAGHFTEAIPLYAEALHYGLKDVRAYLHLGDSYLATERFREAVLVYEEMLRSLPPHPSAVHNLARLYDQLSGADRAIDLYKKYDQQLELDVKGTVHLAGLYKRRGEFDLAAPLFERVIVQAPDLLPPKLNFAEMLAWMKQYTRAIAIYEKVLEQWPNDKVVLAELARTLVWKGDSSRACSVYERALELPEQGVETPGREAFGRKADSKLLRWELARAYSQAKRFNDAEGAYRALLQGDPALYEATVELATVLSWEGKRDEALAIIKGIPEDRARDKIKVFLAEHYVSQREFKKAEQLYNEYLQQFPADNQVRMKYAEVLGWEKQFEPAKTEYHTILESNPPNWIARAVDEKTVLLLANFHSERKEFAEARNLYGLYLTMYPEDSNARAEYARVVTAAGDYTEALAQYERILAGLEGPQIELRRQKAYVLALKKSYKEAEALYRALHEEEPTNAQISRELAQVLYWKDEHEESLKVLNEIPESDLTPEVLVIKAEIFTAQKKFDLAGDAYRHYLVERPDDNDARFKYAEMLSWSKRFADSLKEYEKILSHRPDDVNLRRRYALVLGWAGRKDEALAQLEKADKLQKEQDQKSGGKETGHES